MPQKVLVKHRRGTTTEWQEWCRNPNNILLESEIAIEDALDGMRLIVGDGKHHPYEEFPKLYLPGYAHEVDGIVVASGYDYAEYFKWDDGNPNNEDRTGRFVAITNNTRNIHLATPDDSVLGVTSTTASIVGNWAQNKQDDIAWAIVGMIGIVEVKYEGDCVCGGYAMIGDNGIAVPAIGAFGYKIVKLNEDRGVAEIVLGNNLDMIARIKEDIVDLEKNLGDIPNQFYYTNLTPVLTPHGGIEAGDTFDNVPITDMLTKILYPWVAPVVSAASTPKGGVYEKGDIQTVTAINTTITKKSNNIIKVEAFDGSTSLGTKTEGELDAINNGSGSLVFPVSIAVSSNQNFTVQVTDSDNKVTSASTGRFAFVYPYYYGVITTGDTVDFDSLTKIIQEKGTKAVTYTANNQKMVFATPVDNGVIKKITDPNGFDVTSTFTQSIVSVTGLDGTAQDYYLYTANDASTITSFRMTFYH